MIWSAIWCLVSTSKFFKDNEIARTRWASANFLVFEIFTSAYLHQITREIILLLIKDLYEKSVAESREILMAHPRYL